MTTWTDGRDPGLAHPPPPRRTTEEIVTDLRRRFGFKPFLEMAAGRDLGQLVLATERVLPLWGRPHAYDVAMKTGRAFLGVDARRQNARLFVFDGRLRRGVYCGLTSETAKGVPARLHPWVREIGGDFARSASRRWTWVTAATYLGNLVDAYVPGGGLTDDNPPPDDQYVDQPDLPL